MQLTELEKKHNERLSSLASECAVLLKKDEKFPLERAGRLALFGCGARQTIKGGTGSGGVNSRFYITAEQGLERAGFTLTSKAWLDAYDEVRKSWHDDFIASIKRRAEEEHVSPFVAGFGKVMPEQDYDIPLNGEGDAAVYVLGRVSGEGNDRRAQKGDVLLTDTEVRDILTLSERFERFMLVLNVGGVVDLSPVVEKVGNILLLSQLGVVTGDVLADILLGKANPSGRLTTTWAAADGYCPLGEFGDMNDTRYKEGIYVGYRWFDAAKKTPLFPFGYGLSYTDFRITYGKISHEKSKITLFASVENIGTRAGKQVVQLYVCPPQGKLNREAQSLAAFTKTKLLASGEKLEIQLSFDFADLSAFDEFRAQYLLEGGSYLIRLGEHSRKSVVCAAIELTDEIVVKRVKNCIDKPDFTDAVIPVQNERAENVPVLRLTSLDFDCKRVDYDIETKVHPDAQKLTDEQLCYLCVGAYVKQSAPGFIGNSAFHICGAAGETTNQLKEQLGERYIVMADGPAGLRLSAKYAKTETGVMPATSALPDDLEDIMSDEIKQYLHAAMAEAQKYPIFEQYTTAIPIATAIAQSWNVELARQCGDIVGAEMEKFGVHLWLAPALNIHRNILCGRNFEYYSEDPYLSGMMAAYVTKGVQAHPHCGTTIKHFAANNQENNRYNSNSILSERALREIYLRGFEICIRESAPAAVMTSYNLINGRHTSEHYGLCTDILRGEWGYEGFVMTDWITTGFNYNPNSKHPPAYTSNIVKAGGDITMAGGQGDYDDLLFALKSGKVKRGEVLACASRVLYAIDGLRG